MDAFQSAVRLMACIGVVALAAASGMLLGRPGDGGWYAALHKPSFTPPNRIFAPVWTLLYLMMAVAAWVVWTRGGFAARKFELILFLVQLVLNAAWTPTFFGAHKIGAALAVIITLWAAILATLISFWRASPVAGALLVPYQLWVTFAAALNFAIWRLNR